MSISNELKVKSLALNRICFIISIVMNILVCVSMWGLCKTIIHDGFGTYYSTAEGWAFIMVFFLIIVNSLFITLFYYLINIFITSRDVLETSKDEA
jgi:uncharacterized membrane protein